MITLKDFMEIVDYRITEGSDYQWACFGPTAYRLDSWNGEQDGHTVSVLFDTHSQEVYQVEAFDYSNERAYRMTNSKYKDLFKEECQHRDVMDVAWQRDDGTDVEYVDLDVVEDFVEKARAIVTGEDYDTRVKVPVDFSDEELLTYMKMAHERDMTFNAFVEMALRAAIDEIKLRENVDMRDEYDFSEANRVHITNTDNPIDFPVKKKKKGKK
jgi:hypothetical protein